MVRGVEPAMADARAAGVVTVVVSPPAPPIVAPRGLSFAKPVRAGSGDCGCAEALRREVLRVMTVSFIVMRICGKVDVGETTLLCGLLLHIFEQWMSLESPFPSVLTTPANYPELWSLRR